jgi:hypothetical protein
MYYSKGNIYFYPKNYSDTQWAIVNCDPEIVEYYIYWIKKHYWLEKLQKPKHGSHITTIRGESVSDEIYNSIWTKYQNEEIEFEYTNEISTNGEHFWLPVHCNRLLDIREEMGLVRNPEFSLHLTIARLREEDMIKFK